MDESRVLKVSQSEAFEIARYTPHEIQRRAHAARATSRFRVMDAGRRFGKSVVGGHDLYAAAFDAYARRAEYEPKGKRAEYWIVGPEYTDAEKEFRVLYNALLRSGAEFDKPGTYYDVGGGNMHISLFGGRYQVHAKSAKYPDTLVGEGLHGIIIAEAAKMKASVWPKYLRPMLADYRGWALMASTPEGRNWFYDSFMRGQDPEQPNWWSVRAPAWANPHLFPLGRMDPEILDMEGDMPEEKFKQEIGAEFTEFVGRVFKDFDEETHVGNYRYNPRWPLVIATDYGFTNPNVALFMQWDNWDNVWICAEYYAHNRTSHEFAEDILKDPILAPLARAATLLYPDPEDPGATATIAKAWGVTPRGNTGGLLKDRLDLIRRWLRPQPLELEDGHPEKLPKLHVDFSCRNTIREMSEYRYPETRDEVRNPVENPVKKDDHTTEALTRFFGGHYGKKAGVSVPAKVSSARIRRAR